MSQDLFVTASSLQIEIAKHELPAQSIRGFNFLSLYNYLAEINSHLAANDSDVWALFLVAHVDWHSIYRKQNTSIAFETYKLSTEQHPIWHPNINYPILAQSGEDPIWRELTHTIPKFLDDEPALPTQIVSVNGEEYFEFMFKKTAIKALKNVDCNYEPTKKFSFVSPNSNQVINLGPQHPAGLHLFCSFAGETYEDAINSAMILAEYSKS